MSFQTCLLITLGGALGTLGRYLVTLATAPLSRNMPWGTIIAVNTVGSFTIGFFGTLTLAQGRFPVSENIRLLVMVGMCGGYTTFSSFSLQTWELMRADAWGRATLNILLSCLLCVSAVSLGHLAASKLNGGAFQIAQEEFEDDA